MITPNEAKEYLNTVGVSLPDFLLAALIEQVNTIDDCLSAHYSEATALLIQCYLIGLMALGQGDRYVSSQTAPSGASQSFRYQSFSDRWSGLLSLLKGLDKHGCTVNLIPSDPTKKAYGGMKVVRARCMRGR